MPTPAFPPSTTEGTCMCAKRTKKALISESDVTASLVGKGIADFTEAQGPCTV